MSDRLADIERDGIMRTPTVALCRVDTCNFEWPIAYLPMDLNKWAKIAQRASCPMCGDTKPLLKGNGIKDKPDLTMVLG